MAGGFVLTIFLIICSTTIHSLTSAVNTENHNYDEEGYTSNSTVWDDADYRPPPPPTFHSPWEPSEEFYQRFEKPVADMIRNKVKEMFIQWRTRTLLPLYQCRYSCEQWVPSKEYLQAMETTYEPDPKSSPADHAQKNPPQTAEYMQAANKPAPKSSPAHHAQNNSPPIATAEYRQTANEPAPKSSPAHHAQNNPPPIATAEYRQTANEPAPKSSPAHHAQNNSPPIATAGYRQTANEPAPKSSPAQHAQKSPTPTAPAADKPPTDNIDQKCPTIRKVIETCTRMERHPSVNYAYSYSCTYTDECCNEILTVNEECMLLNPSIEWLKGICCNQDATPGGNAKA